MKKQTLMRVLFLAVIISAALAVFAATRTNRSAGMSNDDCTEQACPDEEKVQSEFFLEFLTRSFFSR